MIYPGAVWVGGVAAGYARGRNAMRACTLHYTVGIDSTGIGVQGYFNFLVAKDGTVEQFAEADALTWHAGEANPTGPGIEFERLSDAEPLTPEQIAAGGALTAWLIGLGIPDTFHDGARIPPAAMSGFVTHRSIQQSQPHSDYITADDWAAMRVGLSTSQGAAPVYHMITDGPAPGNPRTFKVDGLQILSEIAYGAPRGAYAIHQEALDAQAKHGIPIVDGRVAPPYGTEPLATTVQRYTSGAWQPGPGGGSCQFQPAPTTFKAA